MCFGSKCRPLVKLAPSRVLVGRYFRFGLSFLFRAVPVSLLGTLALLGVTI